MLIIDSREYATNSFGDLCSGDCFIDPEDDTVNMKTSQDDCVNAVCLSTGELWEANPETRVITVKAKLEIW